MHSARSEVSVCSRTQYNPITGEEVAYAVRPTSKTHARPDGVPKLSLLDNESTRKAGAEEWRYRPITGANPVSGPGPQSPDRVSVISWGSESTTARSKRHGDKQAPSSGRQPVVSSRPMSSHRVVPPWAVQEEDKEEEEESDQPIEMSVRSATGNSRRQKMVQGSHEVSVPRLFSPDEPRDSYRGTRDKQGVEDSRGYDSTRKEADRYYQQERMKSRENFRENEPISDRNSRREAGRRDQEVQGQDRNGYQRDRFGGYHDDRLSARGRRSASPTLTPESSRSGSSVEDTRPHVVIDEGVQAAIVEDKNDMNFKESRVKEEMAKVWAQSTTTKSTEKLGMNEDDLEARARRNEELSKTVVTDHLALTENCDAEPLTRHQVNAALKHMPGMPRGALRRVHESKIHTSSNVAEGLLTNRVRFNARLITPSGHDAVRDLAGFFFASDNTLTLYEYRQFKGKTSKALPLLKRGSYQSVWGLQRNVPYSLLDIFTGNTLYISTVDQPSLPDSLRVFDMLKLRITDVDDQTKRAALEAGLSHCVPDSQWTSVITKLHMTRCPIDAQVQVELAKLHQYVQERLRRRCPLAIWTALYAYYRDVVREGVSHGGDGEGQEPTLTREQLEDGAKKYKVPVNEDDMDIVWAAVDPEVHGEAGDQFHYTEFMRLLLGEMSEARRAIVRKAFIKMDPGRNGVVSFNDIQRFYRLGSRAARSFVPGNVEIDLPSVLETFGQMGRIAATVSYLEFEIFYEGISQSVEEDETFLQLMKSSWTI